MPNFTTKLSMREQELLDQYVREKLDRKAQWEAEEAAAALAKA